MSQNLFNSVQMRKPKKNHFDLSHDVKLSLNMGELIPTLVLECVPGDTFHLGCDSLLRFAPLVAPVMHQMNVYMHYFFVPNRILWDGWEYFITNQFRPGASGVPPFSILQCNESNYNASKLWDYLGLPDMTGSGRSSPVTAMPFAAYQKIYDEFYRDQNLIAPLFTAGNSPLLDGDNGSQLGVLAAVRKRAWMHDYFTGALPFAQKGSAVDIPLGDVKLKTTTPSNAWLVKKASDHALKSTGTVLSTVAGHLSDNDSGGADDVVLDPNGSLEVDATTINDLRRAFKLQEWFERNARGGTRYAEHILAHFGVKSPDARLQRPEYIVGTKSPVVVSEVLNTSDTATAPQGNMSGHGASVTTGKYGKYFCQEHGYIIGIMSVMPVTAYQDGLPRMWKKVVDFSDYYFEAFSHLGEQPVLKEEVYARGSAWADTFGYVPRYAEYKYMPSRVAGDFKTTLGFWHLGRKFAANQSLNQAFIECDPRTDIFAVTGADTQHLYAHVLHKITAIRPMPKFGTPAL